MLIYLEQCIIKFFLIHGKLHLLTRIKCAHKSSIDAQHVHGRSLAGIFLTPTWVVLGEARQWLGGVHANIVLGEDDLAVQARAQRRSPRRGVEGQEVGGLGGGASQEPTERHLLRRGDAGSILWGAEEAVKVNDGPTSRDFPRWTSGRGTRSTLRRHQVSHTGPAFYCSVLPPCSFSSPSTPPLARRLQPPRNKQTRRATEPVHKHAGPSPV